MGKYAPLANYLKTQPPSVTQLVLTFAQIAAIIGGTLPNAARCFFRWWDNEPLGAVQTYAWRNAGWKTVMVDLENEKVRFQRG